MIEQLLWGFFEGKQLDMVCHQVTVNTTRMRMRMVMRQKWDTEGILWLISLPFWDLGWGWGGFGCWQIFGGWKLTSFRLSRTWGAQAVWPMQMNPRHQRHSTILHLLLGEVTKLSWAGAQIRISVTSWVIDRQTDSAFLWGCWWWCGVVCVKGGTKGIQRLISSPLGFWGRGIRLLLLLLPERSVQKGKKSFPRKQFRGGFWHKQPGNHFMRNFWDQIFCPDKYPTNGKHNSRLLCAILCTVGACHLTTKHWQSAGSSLFAPYKARRQADYRRVWSPLLIHCIPVQRHTYASVWDQARAMQAFTKIVFVIECFTYNCKHRVRIRTRSIFFAHIVDAKIHSYASMMDCIIGLRTRHSPSGHSPWYHFLCPCYSS